MIFNRFFSKGQLCLWIVFLMGFTSCTAFKGAKETGSFGDWEMDVLVDSGLRLEALDEGQVEIVRADEINEPLAYKLNMKSQNRIYMYALRNRVLATGALQVSLIRRTIKYDDYTNKDFR